MRINVRPSAILNDRTQLWECEAPAEPAVRQEPHPPFSRIALGHLARLCCGCLVTCLAMTAAAAEPARSANSTNINFASGDVDPDASTQYTVRRHDVLGRTIPSRRPARSVARLAAHAKSYSQTGAAYHAVRYANIQTRHLPENPAIALTSAATPTYYAGHGHVVGAACGSCGHCRQCGDWARLLGGRRRPVAFSLYDWFAEHPVLSYTAVTAAIVVPIVVFNENRN